MRRPDQFLSIFFLDPRIFQQVDDSQFEKYRNGWEEISRRVLADRCPIGPTSAVGALVINFKTKNGLLWLDEVTKIASHDNLVQEFLNDLAESRRLITIDLEFEVDDVLSLSEDEKEKLALHHGVTGFLDIGCFEEQTYKTELWWSQYKSKLRKCDNIKRREELRNILLYAEEIVIIDEYWQPDNNPEAKGSTDIGYGENKEFFSLIKQNKNCPLVEIYTTKRGSYFQTTKKRKDGSIKKVFKWGLHFLTNYPEIKTRNGKISSLKDFLDRASSTFFGLKVCLKFISLKTFHSRALITNIGAFRPSYGPTQHFPDREDIWSIDDSFDYESDSLHANESLIEYYEFYSNGSHSAKRRP